MKNLIFPFLFIIAKVFNSYSQSIANYTITVNTIWNTTAHTSVPINAHWSDLVGATHQNPNTVLEFDSPAPVTNGIKDVAEIGNNTNFKNEINTLIAAGEANQYLQQGFASFAGNDSTSILANISVSEAFPLITLVSMVAPSPDWFIAMNSLNLRSGNDAINNGWKPTFTENVYVYDAGTDSGGNYTSGNIITTPREPITLVSGTPINGNSMATITFTYNDSTLSSTANEYLDAIKIVPNPTQGKIRILNTTLINIETIKMYTILGGLVTHVSVKSEASDLKINLTSLQKGVYVIKLETMDGLIKTQKLVIK